MRVSNDKQINNLVKQLKRSGWHIAKGTKHYAIVSPKGTKHTIPKTPSDWRASKNFEKDIQRLARRQ